MCKAKELQQGDFHLSSLKDEANKKAYENLENSKKREVKVSNAVFFVANFYFRSASKRENALRRNISTYVFFRQVESAASERMETAAEAQGLNVTPWGADEQKLLEQALKTYPSSLGAERWEKISQAVPNRSKKDCMKRYKELAEIIRAKKAAQAAAQKK